MHISYITYARMPTEKAHGLQIASMCAAFVENGHEVELITPAFQNPITESVAEYYKLRHSFPHTMVPSWDFVANTKKPTPLHHYLSELSFALKCLFVKLPHDTVVYTRSSLLVPIFSFRGYRVICEEHFWPQSGSWLHAQFLKRATCVPCNSEGTHKACVAHGLSNSFVAPNAIDETMFEVVETKAEARTRLGLPQDAIILMYVGALESWKGVEILCKSAEYLEGRAKIVVIGGKESQVTELQKKHPAVQFLGSRPYHELPSNQQAADILVVPNSPESKESQEYTSPIKLFAHMASGIPTLVSDLPSMRAIGGEDMLWFFEAGNPRALAHAALKIIRSPESVRSRTPFAQRYAALNTWTTRAKKILSNLTQAGN